VPPPLPDHDCSFSEPALAYIAEVEAKVSDLEAEVRELKARLEVHERHRFGQKSEKMPPPREALKKEGEKADPAAIQALREERREAKARLGKERVEHKVAPEVQACCPRCQAGPLRPLGSGEVTRVVERVPARLVVHEHVVQTMVCPACEHIETARTAVRRFGQQGQYGASVVADIIVSKTVDAVPLYRLSARTEREGLRLHRNTMLDLYHRGADELLPVYRRLVALVATAAVVQADETVLRRQRGEVKGQSGNGWMWTFLADVGSALLVAYVYSATRSGQTPVKVLGGTPGTLVVDAYTGYNPVTTPGNRTRSGCLAHSRRKFFDAKKDGGAAADAGLALLLEAYRVEHDAFAQGIVGTPAHGELRQTRGRAAMDAVKAWADAEEDRHLPKGPMGKALRYLLGQWTELTRYLGDVRIPIDNNRSERALRAIALGRKNFQCVGHEAAGQNTAVLYSMVATCVANGVNPSEWLEDVLIRVQTWPANRLDELLPHRWRKGASPDDEPPEDEPHGDDPDDDPEPADEAAGDPEAVLPDG